MLSYWSEWLGFMLWESFPSIARRTPLQTITAARSLQSSHHLSEWNTRSKSSLTHSNTPRALPLLTCCIGRVSRQLGAYWRESRVVVHVAKERPDGPHNCRHFVIRWVPSFHITTTTHALYDTQHLRSRRYRKSSVFSLKVPFNCYWTWSVLRKPSDME